MNNLKSFEINTPTYSNKQETQETENIWQESFDFIKDEQLKEAIIKYVKNPKNFLGKGGAAMVFSLETQCIKLLKNRHNSDLVNQYNLGNTVQNEFFIQSLLNNFDIGGVHSPKIIAYYIGKENAAIIMEKLTAANLQLVINKTEDLPKKFDPENFIIQLEQYIYEMHDLGIVHGDLFPRNIMIDKQTGLPRIIDFGRAIYSPTKDQNFQKVLKEDLENLDKIIEMINKLNLDKNN